jgi:general secretion pathway protein B
VSFILDALRKSEHERQRSTVPGLAQVPLATPQPQVPRWALAVMGVLAAALLVIGGAWWQSTRAPVQAATTATTPPATVERSLDVPPPALQRSPQPAAPARVPPQESTPSLAAAAGPGAAADTAELPRSSLSERNSPSEAPSLPSAASLAAEGVLVPALRLELHAYSGRPRDRFVFINGRKYGEGDRLAEGPQLVSIEPTGAVLTHAGRRFLLVQE